MSKNIIYLYNGDRVRMFPSTDFFHFLETVVAHNKQGELQLNNYMTLRLLTTITLTQL